MSQFLVKARHPTKINSTYVDPSDGWVLIYGFLLSELPSRDFIVKKPVHETGSCCPKCGGVMDTVWFEWEILCMGCGFKSDWVYARYKITWRG